MKNDTRVTGDSFNKNTIDIHDIKNAKALAIGMLIHAFEEQYAKQVLGIEDYSTAHNSYAVPAEEGVLGAERSDHPTGLFTATLVYVFDDGMRVCAQGDVLAGTIIVYNCALPKRGR